MSMSNKTVCEKNTCCGCYACEEVCPKGAITICDEKQFYNAKIDENKCIECDLCHSVCPNIKKPEFKSQVAWYQGWTRDEVREKSSSGGLAYAISERFLLDGGAVCTCVFENGEFLFRMITSMEALKNTQGSKYVKSNPKHSYKSILKWLKQQKNVLFIGLPCQVAAIKNYVGDKYEELLYTVDLICHGTPSPKVLENFLEEHNISLPELKEIIFRDKFHFGLVAGEPINPHGMPDKYTIAFMEGLCYTENCYSCSYARTERVSDLTLGDSWGTEMKEEISGGISLALCQTEKGQQLLKDADCQLFDVNLQTAIEANHQLRTPSSKPACYESFFKGMKRKTLSSMVVRYRFHVCLKQEIKKLLRFVR